MKTYPLLSSSLLYSPCFMYKVRTLTLRNVSFAHVGECIRRTIYFLLPK